MKRYLFSALAVSAVAIGGIGQAAQASTANDLVGTWVNDDTNTRGITKIVVTGNSSSGYKIHAYGQCHPSDCDWGTVPMTTYGDSVQDTTHKAGTAVYKPGFAETLLTLNAGAPNKLSVQSFTKFLDHSGRQNYTGRYQFSRKIFVPIPPVLVSPVLLPQL
jgi:hypothetical protein